MLELNAINNAVLSPYMSPDNIAQNVRKKLRIYVEKTINTVY